MEIMIFIIVIALAIALLNLGKSEDTVRTNDDNIRKFVDYTFEEEREKLEKERDALVEELNTIQDAEKSTDSKRVLITKSLFEEMYQQLKETCDLIMDICRESDFQKFMGSINSGTCDLSQSKELFSSMKFFIMQDILKSYEQLGHKYYKNSKSDLYKQCTIEFDTSEGQLLFCIVMQIMRLDSYNKLSWDDFESAIKGSNEYGRDIRRISVEALGTYVNADMKITSKIGLDDFGVCMLLNNYNKDYEDKYRKKMLRIATIIAHADGKVTKTENNWLDNIPNMGTSQMATNTKSEVKNPSEELNRMIGLRRVKEEINSLRNYVIMRKKREDMGMTTPNMSYHCVFSGNPGTGKTTVARLLAGIYKELGVLKKGHLVETDRSGLVAEYVGQTAVKTNKIIDSALDGVLFIDEAYTLANGGANDYGPEAIATLLKRMEDDRDRLVVILAGYSNEIESFINSNPGLRSRFNRYIFFDDYTAEELYKIFCMQIEKSEYKLTDVAKLYLKEKLASVVANKSYDFGNARYVRNLFEKAVESQANRLALEKKWTKEDLTLITKDDLVSFL